MRKLTLKTDRLTELDSDDLARIAAGEATRICLTDPCITPPPYTGLKCLLTEGCA